jgi:hypothetical protein
VAASAWTSLTSCPTGSSRATAARPQVGSPVDH